MTTLRSWALVATFAATFFHDQVYDANPILGMLYALALGVLVSTLCLPAQRDRRKVEKYNLARLKLIQAWGRANRADLSDDYARGYRDALETSVRTTAKELAR